MTKKAEGFPVIHCEEWQCRFVFPDRMCCVLSIGHEGEHQSTCGHGWHFGGRCTEARIVASELEGPAGELQRSQKSRADAQTTEPQSVRSAGTTTPGPWKWLDYPDGRKLLTGLDRAVIHCPDAPMSVEAADARLIAAAPDLLEALRAILEQFDAGCFVRNTDNDGCSDWAIKAAKPLAALAAAKAAIAKVAEG